MHYMDTASLLVHIGRQIVGLHNAGRKLNEVSRPPPFPLLSTPILMLNGTDLSLTTGKSSKEKEYFRIVCAEDCLHLG
jgi:hypothetical protein